VTNAGERPNAPTVIAASRSGPASVFYYDVNVSPEGSGFWVWGSRRTRVTFARRSASDPLVLRVHSGPIDNRLHLTAFGWRHTANLKPQLPVEVEVTPGAGTLVTLDLEADLSFVPRELDSQSSDTRSLGVWVEVVK
jgi:hypothetical protein